MQLSKAHLIEQLEQANQYLAAKIEPEPNYNHLIAKFQHIAASLPQKKPIIKIASNSPQLANRFKKMAEASIKLRSLYTWQILSDNKDIKEVIKHCELICFIYNSQQAIAYLDELLTENYNVERVVLVTNSYSPTQAETQTISDWLNKSGVNSQARLLLPFNNYFALDSELDFNHFEQYLVDLFATAESRLFQRLIRQIKFKTDRYFSAKKAAIWQNIKQQRNLYANGECLDIFKQKINQVNQQINKEQQQVFRKIKQKVNQLRLELSNPFLPNSLIHPLQQAIENSQTKLVPFEGESYLYLVVAEPEYITFIHTYIADTCQKNLDALLTNQWHLIDNIYGDGGLKKLSKSLVQQLQIVEHLYESKIEIVPGDRPRFDITKTVCISTLETNSRIIFDYHFSQSSWFKLGVSALFGVAIYFISEFFTGIGRFFGFFILIFQIINIFTGQDVKALKLKQQTKEIKRMVDNRTQSLVRLLIERFVQDLIINLDDENQRYKQQVDEIVTAANLKLDEVKQDIEQQKLRLDSLKQDHIKILSFFNHNNLD